MPDLRLDALSDRAASEVALELRAAKARLEALLSRSVGLTDYQRLVIQQRRSAIERELDALASALRGRMGQIAEDGARGAAADVSDLVGLRFGVDSGVVAFSQQTAADQVVAVTDAVRNALRRSVTRALAGGLSRSELDAEILKSFGGTETEARVERIARTELGRAYGQQGAAMNAEILSRGVDLIQRWTGIADARTREDHLAVFGQERELDEPFHVGEGADASTPPDAGIGFECSAPLDPALPPEESINCRCRRVLVPRSEAVQPYIAKDRRAVPVDVGGSVGHGRKPPEAPARA